MKLLPQKINMVIDGQFGSTGKGLVAGYIAAKHDAKIALLASNAAPNAGHTVDFGDDEGPKITNHLPCAALHWRNRQSLIYLCAGSIINPDVLLDEMTRLGVDPSRVYIHPHAAIIEPEDIKFEKMASSGAAKIASTQKGVGSALARKINRRGNIANAHLERFTEMGVHVKELDVKDILSRSPDHTCLMEVPQGYSLGINSGAYPHTTSREVSVSQALSDMLCPPQSVGNVMMALRTYPIRVGNLKNQNGKEIGNSGPFYRDQTELDWKFFGRLGIKPEKTTVTGRVRRIATFSYEQYKDALRVNSPSHVFLNFCNYFRSPYELLGLVRAMDECGVGPTHLGFGPTIKNVVERTDFNGVSDIRDLWVKHRGA